MNEPQRYHAQNPLDPQAKPGVMYPGPQGEWVRFEEKWRAFDTAPEDGTEIIVYRPDAGVFTASYVPSYGDGDHGEFGMDHTGPECWFTPAGEDLSEDLPTLWQPLPASPEVCP